MKQVIKCLVCGKEITTKQKLNSLFNHIRTSHKLTKLDYFNNYFVNSNHQIKHNCDFCKINKTEFDTFKLDKNNLLQPVFKKYCSKECSNKMRRQKLKQNKKQLTEQEKNKILEKRKKTNLEKFGTEFTFQSNEIKEKIKQTNLKKYGVENVNFNETIRDKIKQTNLEKFGTEFTFQSNEIKEKIKQTNLEKYGVNYPSQSETIRDKIKQTNIDRYGVKNIFQSKEIKEKIKQTNLEKYGVERPTGFGTNSFTKCMIEKYGVKTPMENLKIKEKVKESLHKHFVQRIFSGGRLHNLVIPLFSQDDYKDSSLLYEFQCVKCGNVFKSYLNDGVIPRCLNCFPIKRNIGPVETDIFQWLTSLNPNLKIIRNDREVLNGKEIDILFPDYNFGIEVDELYWHCEIKPVNNSKGKDLNYHRNKTDLAKEKGIKLIHIFDNEWLNEKQPILKSIILNNLKMIEKRIYARKCQIVDNLSNEITNKFLFENHLQGQGNGFYKAGLYYENELVSVMVIGKNRFKKGTLEIIRFANKLNTNVIGGFSKLFKNFIKNYNYLSLTQQTIYSYADLRFFDGNSYKSGGFKFDKRTKPSYFYTKDYKTLENRMKFQKHKLKNILDEFNPNLSEWENLQLNGYNRIFDCGTNIFSYKQYK